MQELFVRINNLAIEGVPEDMMVATHVCRGNFHSTYASSGAYNDVAKVLLSRRMSTHIILNLTMREAEALSRLRM